MNKEKTYLTYALHFITILLVITGISLMLSALFFILGIVKVNPFGIEVLSIELSGETASPVDIIRYYISGYLIYFVLFCVRQFFKNILSEQIFISQNVSLARRVSLSLCIAAFLGEGDLTINGFSFLNIYYLVTALVVWTLGKVLEKANQIAEENEFTI